MRNYYVTFLAIFIGLFFVQAQSEIFSIKNEEISQGLLSKDIFAIPNSETKDLALFLGDQKDLWIYLLDENFIKTTSFKVENDLHGKFDQAIGYQINKDNYQLIVANDSKKRFELLNYEFGEQDASIINIDFKFPKRENFLQSLQYKNKFYLLSANDENQLVIRKLNSKGSFEIMQSYDLGKFDKDNKLIRSDIALSFQNEKQDSNFFSAFDLFGRKENVEWINYKEENSISITSRKNKLYQESQMIHLSMEVDGKFTAIYSVDLETLKMEQRYFPYSEANLDRFKDYNSFLYKDILFQVSASKQEMLLQIKNLNGEILNEFRINENDEKIEFSNTPIIQEGSQFSPFDRHLEKPSKFLRKLMKGEIGLNVVEKNENYLVQIGSYLEQNFSSSNPNSFSSSSGFNSLGFNHSQVTRFTHITVLLDNELKSKDANLPISVYDDIYDFEHGLRYQIPSYVFPYEESILFGYFDSRSQEFKLLEF